MGEADKLKLRKWSHFAHRYPAAMSKSQCPLLPVTPRTVLQMHVLSGGFGGQCTVRVSGYSMTLGRFCAPSSTTGRASSGPLRGYLWTHGSGLGQSDPSHVTMSHGMWHGMVDHAPRFQPIPGLGRN